MAKKNGSLANLMAETNKQFGDGTMQSFETEANQKVECVASGSTALDAALGGGFPLGRIVEIYGPESSGKTTLTLHAIANIQKAGKAALFLDLENAFDPAYAKNLGIDFSTDKWMFSQPDCGEDAFTILEKFVSHEDIGVIVVDSVAAMTPRGEIEGEYGESKMGLHARLMSQGMRKLVGQIKKSNTLVIFINQTREKIGVMFGSPETTTGGNALKFYASQRLRVGKKNGKKDGEELVSNEITVKVIKNKIAPPARVATFFIRFGEGIDVYKETLDMAVELEIITKAGSFFKYEGASIGQGEERARTYLVEHPEIFQEIKDAVDDSIFM